MDKLIPNASFIAEMIEYVQPHNIVATLQTAETGASNTVSYMVQHAHPSRTDPVV